MTVALLSSISCLGVAETDFNTGWTYTLGDGPFELPGIATSSWQPVETPHDWAIEDLPSREEDEVTPTLAVRQGKWRFAEGEGEAKWAAPAYDDSKWRAVQVPSDWRTYGYTDKNAFGWFRRNVTVSAAALAAAKAGTLRLALGDVATADTTYVNGVRVGGIGSMGKAGSCSSALAYRSYPVPAETLHVGEGNVIAVQVWSAGGPIRPPAVRSFVHVSGAISSGNDLFPPANLTLHAALAKCNATSACVGVTFRGTQAAPTDIVQAYFKSVDDVHEDSAWQSFVTESGKPGGLFDWTAPDMRVGPFDPGASPGQKQTGYTIGGVGWYRKSFTPEPSWGEQLSLFVEGCYMNCSIFLNGRHLLTHPCKPESG